MFRAMWLEWFRLTKRLAAWGVFFAFLALQIVFYGGRYYNARDGRGEYWGFPEALPDVLADRATVTTMFTITALLLRCEAPMTAWRRHAP